MVWLYIHIVEVYNDFGIFLLAGIEKFVDFFFFFLVWSALYLLSFIQWDISLEDYLNAQ